MRHLIATLITVLGYSAKAADHRAQDEKTLRDTDVAWVKAVATKDLDRITSFYADDADFFPANAPMAKGKAASSATRPALTNSAPRGQMENRFPTKANTSRSGGRTTRATGK